MKQEIASVFEKGQVKAVPQFEKWFSVKYLIKERKATVQLLRMLQIQIPANTIKLIMWTAILAAVSK